MSQSLPGAPEAGAPAPVWAAPLLALQFLTRVPVPVLDRLAAGQVVTGLAASIRWFPLVGGLVGALTGGVLLATSWVWSSALVAVLVALVVEARADRGDARGRGGRLLRRPGAAGRPGRGRWRSCATAGSAATAPWAWCWRWGLRAAVLASLVATDPVLAALGCLAAGAVGRWCAVALMVSLAPVPRPDGLAKDIGARAGLGDGLVASAWAALLVVPLAVREPVGLLAGVGGAVLVVVALRHQLARRLGGTTGDCLGTGVYAGQLAVLLGVAALIR